MFCAALYSLQHFDEMIGRLGVSLVNLNANASFFENRNFRSIADLLLKPFGLLIVEGGVLQNPVECQQYGCRPKPMVTNDFSLVFVEERRNHLYKVPQGGKTCRKT